MNPEDKKIRTRFAPSPTGFVHVGSLRTALFSFLFARHNGGVHILRIEDTDQNRLIEGSAANLLKVMKSIGIEFDEGFYLKEDQSIAERGEYGPYLQSQRLALYQKHALELIEQGSAYYCFCSEQRLDELRKEQVALKKPPMYDRFCKNLKPEEIKIKLEEFTAAGKNPVVRQAMPVEGQTTIHDLIYGNITYDNSLLDDQVILKSDGFPTYHLAVVVDDHAMKISHVIRGEEWIPSTPKHLLLYKAFGWEPTQFAHLPLILNPDKSKLSKRQGDVAVEDFLKKGYLKEALLNFVAFLGWNPKTQKEIFSLQEFIEEFDLANVNKSAAVFDLNKLDWLNGLYIRQMSGNDLVEVLIPYWKIAGVDISKYDVRYLKAIADLERERLKKLSDIAERTKYFFSKPEYNPELLVWKKSTKKEAKEKISALLKFLSTIGEEQFTKETLEINLKDFIAANGFDNGSVLWPMRTALSGMDKSPGPFEIASTLALGLGKQEVIERLQIAAELLR